MLAAPPPFGLLPASRCQIRAQPLSCGMPCIRLHAAVARSFALAPPLPGRRLALTLLATMFLTLAGCAVPRNDEPPAPGTP
ncbi:hypothetical protein, partial [Nitratidesulfovibrio oxamicus]|uniref:hypothetical protein n=1 Tax=Nitratidesulfovibrio oxamicus TaxID=32016 RepID=UPI001E4E5AF0